MTHETKDLKQIIGETTYTKTIEKGPYTENLIYHLYHKTERPSNFKQRLNNAVENLAETNHQINNQIKNLEQQKKTFKQLQKGLLQDQLQEKV